MGALSGREADEAQAHATTCRACGDELARYRSVRELMALDPVRGAEPALGVAGLLARVNSRLDEAASPPARFAPRAAWLLPAGALAAGLAALLLLRGGPPPAPESPPSRTAAAGSGDAAVPDEMVRRMERSMTRAQTARYLDEAQDVILTVAAPRPCERQGQRVDVEDGAERSRQLLSRRALLLGMGGDDVASVRPVLRDVEYVLREMASLPSCAKEKDLQAIQREVSRRNLMMKIDLMTRELKG
jgi:hypothetical protein